MTTKPKTKKALAAKPEPTLAEQVEAVAYSLEPLRNIDEVVNGLRSISDELGEMAEASAMQIIVAHGDDTDRKRVVEYLKRKHYKVFED